MIFDSSEIITLGSKSAMANQAGNLKADTYKRLAKVLGYLRALGWELEEVHKANGRLEHTNVLSEGPQLGVRQITYMLLSDGLIESMRQYPAIDKFLVAAREDGLIPTEAIGDGSRTIEGGGTEADASEFLDDLQMWHARDHWATQKNRVLVITEKTVVNAQLRKRLNTLGNAPSLVMSGFTSMAKADEIVLKVRERDQGLIILYAGDYDPSGLFMYEVTLKKRMKERCESRGVNHDERVTYQRVAVTEEDTGENPDAAQSLIEKVGGQDKLDHILTSGDRPTGESARIRWWYERGLGDQFWELESINPLTLIDRIGGAVEACISKKAAWRESVRIEKAQKAAMQRDFSRMASRYRRRAW